MLNCLKLVLFILLVIFVYYFAFWFGHKRGMEDKQLCKKRLAEAIEYKMRYMSTCPNDRDIILNMVDPEHFHVDKIPHCKTDCWNKECHSRSPSKKDELPKNFSPEARALCVQKKDMSLYCGMHYQEYWLAVHVKRTMTQNEFDKWLYKYCLRCEYMSDVCVKE